MVQLQEGGKPLLVMISGCAAAEASPGSGEAAPPPRAHPSARCVAGEAVVAEEQTAVIAGVPQAAFADNVQYQFRTENNGGQVAGVGL